MLTRATRHIFRVMFRPVGLVALVLAALVLVAGLIAMPYGPQALLLVVACGVGAASLLAASCYYRIGAHQEAILRQRAELHQSTASAEAALAARQGRLDVVHQAVLDLGRHVGAMDGALRQEPWAAEVKCDYRLLAELSASATAGPAAQLALQRLEVVARQTEARLEQNAASLAALRAEVAPPDGPSVPGLEITLRETAARIEAQAEKEVASLHDELSRLDARQAKVEDDAEKEVASLRDELSRLDARQAKVEDDAEMCVRAVGEVVGRIDLIEDGMVEAAALVEQVARSGGGPGTAPKLAS